MRRKQLVSFAVGVLATVIGSLSASAVEGAGGPWKLGDIVVEQAWARVVPGGAKTGAVYLTIHNKSANEDLLLAVDSDSAQTTAVHESKLVDGVATMEPVPVGILLPSHGEVVMRPGSVHIMLTGLSGVLTPGSMLPVKMVFRDAGTLDFEVPVLPLGAGDPAIKHSGHGG